MAELSWGRWKVRRDGYAECVLLHRRQHVMTVFRNAGRDRFRLAWSDFEHRDLRAKTPESAQREALALLRDRMDRQKQRCNTLIVLACVMLRGDRG